MNLQQASHPNLFAPYARGRDTSKAAAEAIKERIPNLEDQVFELICQSGSGLTCCEVEAWTNLSHQCASARIRGLAIAGKILDSGKRRPTNSGRMAIVWRAA
jgi:hypothetical protein